jgi:hypothetical protein
VSLLNDKKNIKARLLIIKILLGWTLSVGKVYFLIKILFNQAYEK